MGEEVACNFRTTNPVVRRTAVANDWQFAGEGLCNESHSDNA